MLLSLPTVLLSQVFGSFLELHHIGKLDSACCNANFRPVLLSFLRANKCNFCCAVFSNQFLKWAVLRRYRLKSYVFWSRTDVGLFARALTISGPTMCDIEIQDVSVGQMVSVAALLACKCHDIASLVFYRCPLVETIRDAFLANPSLQQLVFDGTFGESSGLFDGVQFPQLHSLTVMNGAILRIPHRAVCTLQSLTCSFDNTCNAMLREIVYIARLRVLFINDCTALNHQLLSRCVEIQRGLVSLTLLQCSHLTDEAVASIATLPKLQVLRLGSNHNFTNASLLHLERLSTTLVTLQFGCSPNFSVAKMENLLDKCVKIASFQWGWGAEHTTAGNLVRHLTNVKTLIISPHMCTDAMLQSVGQHCRQLEVLDLCSMFRENGRSPISSDGLAPVTLICTHLKQLRIPRALYRLYFNDYARELLFKINPRLKVSCEKTENVECCCWW